MNAKRKIIESTNDKATIRLLKRKLRRAEALIVDLRSLMGPWDESLAREADEITADYEARTLR